jgi:hypothetical protein
VNCVMSFDGNVDGGNTLKARCHSVMLIDREGYARFGISRKVESKDGGPKVWIPWESDGTRQLREST